MKEHHHPTPPRNCQWWKPGDETMHPSEDDAFLRSLYKSGCLTYKGPSGLVGAIFGHRDVCVIHRGRGIRWSISFVENSVECISFHAINLPAKATVVEEWLKGGPLETVLETIKENEW